MMLIGTSNYFKTTWPSMLASSVMLENDSEFKNTLPGENCVADFGHLTTLCCTTFASSNSCMHLVSLAIALSTICSSFRGSKSLAQDYNEEIKIYRYRYIRSPVDSIYRYHYAAFVIILAGSAQQLVSLNIFQGKLVLFLTNLLYAQIHHFEQ